MSPEQIAQRKVNQRLETSTIVTMLKTQIPEAVSSASIVGSWIWITFSSKPKQSILESLKVVGFSWNPTRNAWQHPCGVFRKAAKYDPRDRYGIEEIT